MKKNNLTSFLATLFTLYHSYALKPFKQTRLWY